MNSTESDPEAPVRTEGEESRGSTIHAGHHDHDDHEKGSPNTPTFEPAPEGGVRAWLVAGGAAAIFFSTLGFSNSFGTFEQYYLTHQLQSESASKVSWIGSLMTFLQFLTGMVGGPMFDRFGAKVFVNSLISPLSLTEPERPSLPSRCACYQGPACWEYRN